jgi:serine/threonine-protein kinase
LHSVTTRDDGRWGTLQKLFEAAIALPAAERAAYLDAHCRGDYELRREVDAMLASESGATGFLGGIVAAASEAFTSAEPSDIAGQHIGPYRIVRLLGRGGMGNVYLAERDDAFRMRVALKVVRGILSGTDMATRFRTERQILASLEHPGIARLLDGGATSADEPYLVMEYVNGVPIDQYCDAQRLTIDARLDLFLQTCAAVQYAHAQLIVHRDIKPANILVTAAGAPKLLDFGIAKLVSPDSVQQTIVATATGARMLTPSHASPEQVRGEPISTASDVYSLGVLLYELLSGQSPYRFRSGTPGEMERLICEEEPELPSSAASHDAGDDAPNAETVSRARSTTPDRLRRRLAGDLDIIVATALRKEAARRYASVESLADDVRRHRAGLPIAARRDTLRYRAGKYVRRNRAAVFTAAAVLLGLAGVTGFYTMRLAEERDRARAAAAKAEQVAAFLTELFAISDPGRSRGETVTARELLTRGAERIRSDLAGQPDVQADLMDLMGNVHFGLGLYDEAIPLLEQSLATRRRTLGETHVDVAHTLNALGVAYRLRGDYAAAESLAAQGLEIQRRLHTGEHVEVAHSIADYAEVLRVRGDLPRAESLYSEALEMRRRLLGDEHADVADTKNNLALALDARGDHAGAIAMHREALAVRMRLFGENHIDVANSYDNLALALAASGEYAEAERLGRDALRLNRVLLGESEPRTVRIEARLARTLFARGDRAAAEPMARRALAAFRARLGDQHPYVAQSLNDLAEMRAAARDYAAADTLYRSALALRRRLLSPSSPATAETLTGLAAVLEHNGRCREAAPLIEEALAIRRVALRPDHPATGAAAAMLDSCALGRG